MVIFLNLIRNLPDNFSASLYKRQAGDFIAQPDFGMYYVSIDPHGKLGWESATLQYVDTTAHVIEVLTEQVSNAYKEFLRKLGISYIITGKTELDYALALPKTANPAHMASNAEVDFVISDTDMKTLKTMQHIENYGEFNGFPVFSGKPLA